MDFTVIIPYRPRTQWDSFPDLERVLASINVPYIVSVFGEFDDRLSDYVYIHTPTNEKWNRAKALNIGADNSSTEYVFANDADCVWIKPEEVRQSISKSFDKGNHVIYRIIFNGSINQHGAGMQGYSTKWPIRWDEQYETYGREDIDMQMQAKKCRLSTVELSGGIQHSNHPRDRDSFIDDWQANKTKFNKKWKSN